MLSDSFNAGSGLLSQPFPLSSLPLTILFPLSHLLESQCHLFHKLRAKRNEFGGQRG